MISPRLPKAVLFDMDGTLVDTEHLWWEAVEVAAAERGITIHGATDDDVIGRPIDYTARYLVSLGAADEAAVAGELEQRFLQLVGANPSPLPGAIEILKLLRMADIPAALVSASPRSVIDAVLESLGRNYFTTSVAAEEVETPKPAPDQYLRAVELLRVPLKDCVVIEDSPTGIAAAEAAGLPVVMVPSPNPTPDGPRRTRVDSLEQVTLELLGRALTAA